MGQYGRNETVYHIDAEFFDLFVGNVMTTSILRNARQFCSLLFGNNEETVHL